MRHNQESIITTRIRKPRPHSGQSIVLGLLKRFNVLANGRRWGKTILAVKLAMETMLNGGDLSKDGTYRKGGRVGYFVPTFDFAEDFWEEIKERLEPITIYKSETKKIIRLNTGGELQIFSLEKKRAGRGKKFHRVIIDEAAFVKDLKESWEKVIRATLTDFKGDAFFLSSPIFSSYFHELFLNQNKEGFSNWASFKMPTSTNPIISEEELEEIKSQLDPLTWLQEFMAEFVNLLGNAFAHCFSEEKHVVKKGELGLKKFDNGNKNELRTDLPVYLSFDFNENPMTCIASQHPEDKSYIFTRHEFRLEKSDIDELCDIITTKLGGHYFIVTGDKSGSNKTGLQKNLNYYIRIKAKLGLEPHQIILPNKNPFISNNRVLCNSLLYRHPALFIHEECKYLIKDLEMVSMTKDGDIDKKSNPALTHLLDGWRYYLNTFFKSFVKLK